MRLEIYTGDITRLNLDAIVNAANTTLLGGGGVDGAIHRAAGPQLLEECRRIGGCPAGEARITKGYRLPAEYVIHTVGPVWRGGTHQEKALLKNCYINSLKCARDHHIKTLAFPCISTGVYGFPKKEAAVIACRSVQEFLSACPEIEKVVFACFSEADAGLYQQCLHPASSDLAQGPDCA